jgi:hypothetical protein
MAEEATYEGGCLCGAVRYRFSAAPAASVHCHCTMCRRASGAPVVTWVTVPRDRFAFVQGQPVTYKSSASAERRFCPRCGSQLTFRSARWPDDIDVTLGTLDRAEDFPPDHHIFVSSRLAWLHLDEALPAYQGFGPGSPAK